MGGFSHNWLTKARTGGRRNLGLGRDQVHCSDENSGKQARVILS